MAIPRNRTDLSHILSYGIDQKNRILYFGNILDFAEEHSNIITQKSIELATRAIHTMVIDAPNKPITIYMNSYGGDPYAMLYLIDIIHSSPCQFKFYGGGAIMSAATWVMAACDERYLYENATVMVHSGSADFDGKHEDFLISADEEVRLMRILIDIYTENSFMPKEFWEDIIKRDLHLTANEAVVLGLADETVKPRKRGNLRKKRMHHLSTQPHHKTLNSLVKRLYSRISINPKVNEIQVKLPPVDETEADVFVDNTPFMENNEELKDNNEET